MKKLLILLLFIPLVFACSDDSSDDNIDDTNPVYLDTNGVTIKARDWAVVGDQGTIDGVTYTIVDREMFEYLRGSSMYINELPPVCTSRIENMNSLFYETYGNQWNISISSWDVSNVTDMEGMFAFSNAFNDFVFRISNYCKSFF